MLSAVDANGHEILAYNCSEDQLRHIRRKSLFCPACREKVILKAGPIMIPHFAHHKDADCSHHTGEGEDHLQGKLDLYHWALQQGFQAKLEHYMPSIQQRIDLLLKVNNRWFGIEYQNAPITISDHLNRTHGMASRGIFPMWIYGKNYYNPSTKYIRLNTTLKSSVMYFPKSDQSKLWFYDPSSKLFTTASNPIANKSKAFSHLRKKTIDKLTWQELFRPFNVSIPKLKKVWLNEKRRFRSQSRPYVTDLEKAYLKNLYLRYLHPQSLPSCVHLPVNNAHRYNLPNYIWQTTIVLLIADLRIGNSFHWADIYQKTKAHFLSPILSIYPGHPSHPALSYLNVLEQLGYIRRDEPYYIKLRDFYFPKTLDEANQSDEILLQKLLRF
ncbi:competence protein CoiA [Aquisalibacillus elongatus]|uniref:Competence CoiA-like predicted nuclease n=1 Tax=Aquisalibacillus elongatus TaxID=485577 RepID=A0A3N5C6Q7_9BACI|nr:competence protein CoiA family protein [Aquisalibacillus elongatus]RPF52111.1 competence CoiA-like predicted nuclease [Aquisalibacillus elongatus]